MEAVELASYVTDTEATAFTQACVLLSNSSTLVVHERKLAVDIITAAAIAELGPDTRVSVAGSVVKGTAVKGSDLDLLVHTAEPVTLAQRVKLETRLKQHRSLNAAHVVLKKLAIHVNALGCDVDVVFGNTVEFGMRPPADERIAVDAAVRHAAQALNLWAAAHRARKVPGHQLENLALHCRKMSSAVRCVGDGSMQLCLIVLQRVADELGSDALLRTATRLDANTRTVLRAQARSVLHVFAVSRAVMLGACFRDASEITAWLMDFHGGVLLRDTPAGRVPSWLFMSQAKRCGQFALFAEFAHPLGGNEEDHARDNPEALRLMLSSPLGAFTLVNAHHTQSPVRRRMTGLVPNFRP